MDAVLGTQWAIASLGLIVVPAVAYLVRATITNDQKMKTHEATDALNFSTISLGLADLKDEQRDQTQKLDRLVERLPVGRKR